MIYDPAEDSYLLASVLSKYVRNKQVLDCGTGSGILALSSLDFGASEVTAIDINKEAIKNLKKIKNKRLKAIHSNLFQKIPKEKFDVIICNPPYLPEDSLEDQESALITSGGKKGDEFILRFLSQSSNHLNPSGVILLLVSSLTPKKQILSLLKKNKLKKKVIASSSLFMETLEVWEIKKSQ